MRIHGFRYRAQRLLVTSLSSCKSIGSFILTRFRKIYPKWRTLMRNSSFMAKKSITQVRGFLRSVALKKPKDRTISQDTGEKTPTYIVGDIDSTVTITNSGEFTADPKTAHQGPLIPQALSLGEKIESGERPQKRPRDIDAAEPFHVQKPPPSKKTKTQKRRRNVKTRPKQVPAVRGDISFLNLETHKTMDVKIAMPDENVVKASGEAPKVSHKRKSPTSTDSQPGTFPPAKKSAEETSTNSSAKVLGSPELETPQVEMPDFWRQHYMNPLSPEHLSILRSKGEAGMLDDDIINKAQEILQCQYEDFDGLQPS